MGMLYSYSPTLSQRFSQGSFRRLFPGFPALFPEYTECTLNFLLPLYSYGYYTRVDVGSFRLAGVAVGAYYVETRYGDGI